MSKPLTLLPAVLLLCACGTMKEWMEPHSSINGRHMADFLMSDVFNQPIDQLLAKARPSQNDRDVYVIKKFPDNIKFYTGPVSKTLFPAQCRHLREDRVHIRISRRAHPAKPGRFLVSYELGLPKVVLRNGRCAVAEEFMAFVTYRGIVPVHYVHMTWNSNFIYDLQQRGFPMPAAAYQCSDNAYTYRTGASDENTRNCFMDDGDEPNVTLQEQRAVAKQIKFGPFDIAEEELSSSLVDIYTERQQEPGYVDRMARKRDAFQPVMDAYNKAKYEEENIFLAEQARNPEEESNFFGKALAIGAIAGIAANSGLSAEDALAAATPAMKGVLTGEPVNPYDTSRLPPAAQGGAAAGGVGGGGGNFDLACEDTAAEVCVEYSLSSQKDYDRFKAQCASVVQSCRPGPNCYQTAPGRASRTYGYSKSAEYVKATCDRGQGTFSAN